MLQILNRIMIHREAMYVGPSGGIGQGQRSWLKFLQGVDDSRARD